MHATPEAWSGLSVLLLLFKSFPCKFLPFCYVSEVAMSIFPGGPGGEYDIVISLT